MIALLFIMAISFFSSLIVIKNPDMLYLAPKISGQEDVVNFSIMQASILLFFIIGAIRKIGCDILADKCRFLKKLFSSVRMVIVSAVPIILLINFVVFKSAVWISGDIKSLNFLLIIFGYALFICLWEIWDNLGIFSLEYGTSKSRVIVLLAIYISGMVCLPYISKTL